MIVGFTGTRDGMTEEQTEAVIGFLQSFKPTEAHHGDCLGSDSQFHSLIQMYTSALIHVHPPTNNKYRAYCPVSEKDVLHEERDYLVRNRDIVDAADIMIGTPKETTEKLRSGTWAAIRYTRKIGKKLYIIYPNGVLGQ